MGIRLAVVGHRNFYDYGALADAITEYDLAHGPIDLIVIGGSSGTDFNAERWADNHNVDKLIFSSEWAAPRPGLEDTGRPEAGEVLTRKIIDSAGHLIAFPGPDSKWTLRTVEMARDKGIPVEVHELTEEDLDHE